MTEAKQHFKDFLTKIRLTKNQLDDLAKGHKTLRKRLSEDQELSKIVQTTFLQGSYKRNTAVKPKNGKRSDVDIIVVTNLDPDEIAPQDAMDLFKPFLNKHYKDKWEFNSRSIGISLSYVDLDLVITAEVKDESALNYMRKEEGDTFEELEKALNPELLSFETFNVFENLLSNTKKSASPEPILIPDRDKEIWEETNPLSQINWTIDKNSNCNGHYINVVKALKWWKRLNPLPKYPKGYPLEHFVGVNCPDGIAGVAEGIVKVLENIVSDYKNKPFLSDHGVPTHDVFERISDEEYDEFYDLVKNAAVQARKAFDEPDNSKSIEYWRELLGNEFPPPTVPSKENSSYTERKAPTQNIGSARFG